MKKLWAFVKGCLRHEELQVTIKELEEYEENLGFCQRICRQ